MKLYDNKYDKIVCSFCLMDGKKKYADVRIETAWRVLYFCEKHASEWLKRRSL